LLFSRNRVKGKERRDKKSHTYNVQEGSNCCNEADAVYNRLRSTNIRECVRMARLIGNDTDLAKLDRIIDTFTKYAALCSANRDIGIIRQD